MVAVSVSSPLSVSSKEPQHFVSADWHPLDEEARLYMVEHGVTPNEIKGVVDLTGSTGNPDTEAP